MTLNHLNNIIILNYKNHKILLTYYHNKIYNWQINLIDHRNN